MSLIEQAARRLEELRRAGLETGAPLQSPSAPGRDAEPLPESVIRAFEDQKPALRTAQPTAEPAVLRTRPSAPAKHIELDLPRLRAMGFITPDAPMTQISDEFRVLKRPIIRNALGKEGIRVKNGNLVMVTSSLPGEGKTFTSLNLALSIALEYDNTVLLVDGDVAHPTLPRVLNSPNSPGLLDLLTRDDVDVSDALVKTNVEKLSILPAGSRHRRSTELLASEQMASLLRELATRYSDRIIVFDSPPLLATTEARVLATLMGQIVMVVAADATSQHAVTQALATIENCEIVLMLLNKARQTDVGTYYGYYGDEAAP
jgi:receptor protein-tyrosine kinase